MCRPGLQQRLNPNAAVGQAIPLRSFGAQTRLQQRKFEPYPFLVKKPFANKLSANLPVFG
jgi:hypothetical protein